MQKTLVLAIFVLSTLTANAQSVAAGHATGRRPPAGMIVTFDPPGSTYTQPTGINDAGVITGTYASGGTSFGFIRGTSGIFTSFAVPGATDTVPEAINASGEVAGWYADSSNIDHGFVREANGSFVTFDPPESTRTYAVSINGFGEVTGQYLVNDNIAGFVRDALGNITTFEVTGAEYTVPSALSDNGSVTGSYFNPRGRNVSAPIGFVRDSSGTITTFSVAGSGNGAEQGTVPLAINANGETTGYYVTSTNVYHGFSRDQSGNITILDDPKTQKGAEHYGTFPSCINGNGEIAGYADNPEGNFGFSVDAASDWTSFTVPGADQIYGTDPVGINDSGTITGAWVDSTSTRHGFVRY